MYAWVSGANHEEDAGEAEVLEESRDVDFLCHGRSILSIGSGPRVFEDIKAVISVILN